MDISRLYSDSIRSRRVFYPSVSDSEYPIFITDPYPNAQKLHFYNVDIHYNFIRQKLTLSVFDSLFEQKYKNKYDISDIQSVFIPNELWPEVREKSGSVQRRAAQSVR